MKTRLVLIIFFACLILTQSCTVRVPLANTTKTKHHDAVLAINPQYSVKKKGRQLKKYLGYTAGMGLLVGGLSYYANSAGKTLSTQQKMEDFKKGAEYGVYLGALSGLGILLIKKKSNTSIEQISSQNFDKWLSDYNRKQNQNYVKMGQESYGYLLVPKNQLSAYNAEEKRLKDEAERQRVLAEQWRKEQEERDRIARLEREEQERKAQIEREAREKREREEQERRDREYAEAVAKNPDKLNWKPMIEFGEDIIFPSYVLSRASSKVIKLIGCDDPSFHEDNDCASVLGIAVTSPMPNFEITLEITDTDGKYIVPNKRTYTLKERGKRYVLYPTIAWKNEELRNQEQEFTVNLQYKLGLPNSDFVSQRIKPVKMKTIYDCVFGHKPEGESFKSRRFMFAAYVNEKDPTVDMVTEEALKMRAVKSFGGYQGSKKEVLDEVAAVWAAMQNRGIKYSSLTGSDLNLTSGIFSQYVQPLSKVYRNAQANCIDGTVAFASVLKKIGIDPLIVTIPGHAFLGFCTKPKTKEGQKWSDRDPVFLETTLIGSQNITKYDQLLDKIEVSRFTFDKAISVGNSRFWSEVEPNLNNERAYSVIDITFYREIIDPIGK